jgi:DNA-binding GntR family transcriptional regulator
MIRGTAAKTRLSRNETSSEAVHRHLREQILSLALKPGAAISENELALAYGVSRTPVREALLRLSDEGLVEIVPKAGTIVSRIPLEALPEAIVIRRALEEVAVRSAAARASGSQLLGLRAILKRQEEAAQAGDADVFHAADEAFHAALAQAAGYPGIWTLVQQVKVQIDRYRRLTLPQEGRMLRVLKEHAAVASALEKRDADAAAHAMREHLDGLELSLPDIRKLNPDYFAGEPDPLERRP